MITESQMMLGTRWVGQPVRGWLASEKHDGCRAYWDGAALWTRGGNRIDAPAWFTAGLPADMHVEGEIVADGGFFAARNAVNHDDFTPDVRLVIFDAPQIPGALPARLAAARAAIGNNPAHSVIAPEPVRGDNHLRALLDAVLSRGGEGLMLHHPRAEYKRGRTEKLLKVKLAD